MIILDSIELSGDTFIPALRDEKSEFWKEYNIQANKAIRMYYNLYGSGKLESISEYYTEHTGTDDYRIIDFVIDTEKLSPEFIQEMEEKYPGNGLAEADSRRPCHFIGCIGLNNIPYRTYRDINGMIGSSFEHPLTMRLNTDEAYAVYDIAQKSPVNAAIACIKLSWDEDSVTAGIKESEFVTN